MNASDNYAERGVYFSETPSPSECITQINNGSQNPLRGSCGTVKRVQKERSPGDRLAENPTSRKFAMEAMCWDCQGGEHVDPGWKWGIGNCQCTTCPLFAFRPYQQKLGKPAQGAYREEDANCNDRSEVI